MQPQDPRPEPDAPTAGTPTGGPGSPPSWQSTPAQPSWGQPQQEPPPGSLQQPPAQPESWQQPPAQPGFGQPQGPDTGQQPVPGAWQQPPARPSWGQPVQSGWGDPAAVAAPAGNSRRVVAAGIVLLLFSLLPTLFGVIALLAGNTASAMNDLATQFRSYGVDITAEQLRTALVVVGAVLTIFGVLGLLGGIGMLLHRTWGRILAILVALLGTLFGIVAVMGALNGNSGSGGSIIIPLVILVGYGFVLLAAATGGRHFRRH